MNICKSGYKMITLLTSSGRGLEVLNKLYESGHRMVDLHHARGSLVGGALKKNGEPVESEQEILTCVVATEHAESVFELIYDWAHLDSPNGGFMHMQNLSGSTVLTLPKEDGKSA